MNKRLITVFILTLLFLTSCAKEGPVSIIRKGNNNYYKEKSYQKILKKLITVKRGQTIDDIARENDVPVISLIKHNKLKHNHTLSPGDKLELPIAKLYVVKQGDNLYKISKKYNIPVTKLARINKLNPPYLIKTHQNIKLTAGKISKDETEYYNKIQNLKQKNSKIQNLKKENFYKKKKSKNLFTKNAKLGYKEHDLTVPKHNEYKKTSFIWPINGKIISHFGKKGNGLYNDGINISSNLGTSVKAIDIATVSYVGNELKDYGNLIILKHSRNWISAYAHLDKILVQKGEKIKKGEIIGTVGKTGNITKSQLYFGLRRKKVAVDPQLYLR